MYLVVIAWIYVVLMMSVAEATNTNGTVLGAVVTFFLYGVGPAALVAYLMATPARKRAIKKREAEALSAAVLAAPLVEAGLREPNPTQPNPTQPNSVTPNLIQPNTSSHPAGGAEAVTVAASVTPVRKES